MAELISLISRKEINNGKSAIRVEMCLFGI